MYEKCKGLIYWWIKMLVHSLIFMSFQTHMVTLFWGTKKEKLSRMFMLHFSIQWEGMRTKIANQLNKNTIKVIFEATPYSHRMCFWIPVCWFSIGLLCKHVWNRHLWPLRLCILQHVVHCKKKKKPGPRGRHSTF